MPANKSFSSTCVNWWHILNCRFSQVIRKVIAWEQQLTHIHCKQTICTANFFRLFFFSCLCFRDSFFFMCVVFSRNILVISDFVWFFINFSRYKSQRRRKNAFCEFESSQNERTFLRIDIPPRWSTTKKYYKDICTRRGLATIGSQ